MSITMKRVTFSGGGVLAAFSKEHVGKFTCCECGHAWERIGRQIRPEPCPKCGGKVFNFSAEEKK